MNYSRNKSEQPSVILICGNTGLVDKETIKLISEYYRVVVVGEKNSEEWSGRFSKKVNIYNEDITDENFKRIMYSYSPDTVWYFSGYVDGNDGLENELKKTESLIHSCSINEVPKLIVISSIDSLNYSLTESDGSSNSREYATERAFDCAQMEQHVKFCAAKNNLKLVTVRVPYVYKKDNSNTFLGSLFNRLIEKKSISFSFNEKEMVDFLSTRNLTELLIAITEETMDAGGEYTALSGNDHTYKELGENLAKCCQGVDITYNESGFYDLVINKKAEALRLKKEYGFIPGDNVLENIEELYEHYESRVIRKPEVAEKLKAFFSGISINAFRISELVLLFLVVQILLKYTTDNVYFRFVDLRLFFVVIMGITHGMFIGTIAGIMECVSLVYAYNQTGVTGTMLFYNTDYWLPFAIYLMTGAITGYLVTCNNQKQKFAREELAALQSKYLFLNEVYMSVIDNKEEYKRQILGYQDSFGKIFEAVQQLDSSNPADIFMNGVETLEHILNNHSIAIYTMDDYQKYARLVACSREMSSKLSRSLSINEFRDVYDVILGRDTWKNTEFIENEPMYAYGIIEKDKVALMICIYKAGTDQMGLYYMNLFTILCHLIRVSFTRALEYQSAIEDEKYIENTQVLVPEYFEKELKTQRKMSDAGVASYILLKLNTGSIAKTSKKLDKLIRQSDLLGQGEDGNYYLLMTQISRAIFDTIDERLKRNEIDYLLVEGM